MEQVKKPKYIVIENGILKNMELSRTLNIPQGPKEIGGIKEEKDMPNMFFGQGIYYDSFNNNNIIEEVIIPEGVEVIGERAFQNCQNLKKVYIPDGVKEIKSSAFDGCKSLKEIILPRTITLLDNCCFGNIDYVIVTFNGTYNQWRKVNKSKKWITGKATVSIFGFDEELEFCG